MPSCWRIRTRVQGTVQNYSYMESRRLIKRGEEILGEESLAHLPVSLSDLHDTTRFLVPGALHNGLDAVQEMHNDLTAEKQQRLNQLYNAQPNQGLLTQVSTNAYLEEKKVQGHDFRVLRIYDKISRFNHSCRPNAALAYDPSRQMGTLRALRDISQGNEIFVNYRSDEQFTLSDVPQHRQALQQTYSFQCHCAACVSTDNALHLDRNNRRGALQRFNQISIADPAFANDQAKDNHLKWRLQRAIQYAGYLESLQIADGKLAWAY